MARVRSHCPDAAPAAEAPHVGGHHHHQAVEQLEDRQLLEGPGRGHRPPAPAGPAPSALPPEPPVSLPPLIPGPLRIAPLARLPRSRSAVCLAGVRIQCSQQIPSPCRSGAAGGWASACPRSWSSSAPPQRPLGGPGGGRGVRLG